MEPEDKVMKSAVSPLFLEGWLEFNRMKWGVRPTRVKLHMDHNEYPSIDAVFYLNKRGQIRHPDGNAYIALAFNATPNMKYDRVIRQWLKISETLLEEMGTRGLANTLALPPEITDVRPWRWAGYRVGVKYTFTLDFPYDIAQVESDNRTKIRKAAKNGYSCERTTNMGHVHECITETSIRQGFKVNVSVQDLQLARKLLGDEHLRGYVCYGPNGEPVSSKLNLHFPGGRSLGLYAGTKTPHLPYGVNQLLLHYLLMDLQRAGASGLDFAGANIPNIALSKMGWGARLTPYHTIESYGFKPLVKWMWDWWRFRGG